MVLICVFIGIAAPTMLLGFAVGVLAASIDHDLKKETSTENSDERWVSVV